METSGASGSSYDVYPDTADFEVSYEHSVASTITLHHH